LTIFLNQKYPPKNNNNNKNKKRESDLLSLQYFSFYTADKKMRSVFLPKLFETQFLKLKYNGVFFFFFFGIVFCQSSKINNFS